MPSTTITVADLQRFADELGLTGWEPSGIGYYWRDGTPITMRQWMAASSSPEDRQHQRPRRHREHGLAGDGPRLGRRLAGGLREHDLHGGPSPTAQRHPPLERRAVSLLR